MNLVEKGLIRTKILFFLTSMRIDHTIASPLTWTNSTLFHSPNSHLFEVRESRFLGNSMISFFYIFIQIVKSFHWWTIGITLFTNLANHNMISLKVSKESTTGLIAIQRLMLTIHVASSFKKRFGKILVFIWVCET